MTILPLLFAYAGCADNASSGDLSEREKEMLESEKRADMERVKEGVNIITKECPNLDESYTEGGIEISRSCKYDSSSRKYEFKLEASRGLFLGSLARSLAVVDCTDREIRYSIQDSHQDFSLSVGSGMFADYQFSDLSPEAFESFETLCGNVKE
jgi:hypothetical protein